MQAAGNDVPLAAKLCEARWVTDEFVFVDMIVLPGKEFFPLLKSTCDLHKKVTFPAERNGVADFSSGGFAFTAG
jgi:hypothetical protein